MLAAEFEFIELTNTGGKTLDLSGLTFTTGIGGTFANGTALAPGGYLVAARNPTVFNTRYPGAPGAFTISVNANDADGQLARVEFYDGAAKTWFRRTFTVTNAAQSFRATLANGFTP